MAGSRYPWMPSEFSLRLDHRHPARGSWPRVPAEGWYLDAGCANEGTAYRPFERRHVTDDQFLAIIAAIESILMERPAAETATCEGPLLLLARGLATEQERRRQERIAALETARERIDTEIGLLTDG